MREWLSFESVLFPQGRQSDNRGCCQASRVHGVPGLSFPQLPSAVLHIGAVAALSDGAVPTAASDQRGVAWASCSAGLAVASSGGGA